MMSELKEDEQPRISCKICSQMIPLEGLKAHLIGECIPKVLKSYGLPKYTKILNISLKDIRADKEKILSLEEKVGILETKVKKLKKYKIQHKLYNSMSPSSISTHPIIKQEKIEPMSIETPFGDQKLVENNIITPFNINGNNERKVEHIDNKSSLGYMIVGKDSYSSDELDARETCFLSQSFYNKNTPHKILQMCPTPIKSNTRIEIGSGDNSLIICKNSHLVDSNCLKIIKSFLFVEDNKEDYKETVQSSSHIAKCAKCGCKCTTKFSIKHSGVIALSKNYIYFCSFQHLSEYLIVLKIGSWKEMYNERSIGTNDINESPLKKAKISEDSETTVDLPTHPPPTPPPAKDYIDKTDEIFQSLRENEVQSLIGISLVEFEELFVLVQNELGKKPQRTFYKLRDKLCISLIYMKHYSKNVILKLLFGVCGNTIDKYFEEILDILYDLSQANFDSHFKNRTHEDSYDTFFDKNGIAHIITAVVDGSEQRIGTSTNKQNRDDFFSGKKSYPSITKLVYCSPNGKILFMSDSKPGSNLDQGMIYDSISFIQQFEISWEYIIGDKGFQGAHKVYKNFLVVERGERTEQEKIIDNDFKSIRIIIENVFAQIKKFNITTHTLRMKIGRDPMQILKKHHKIWCAVGFLVNKFVEMRPIKT